MAVQQGESICTKKREPNWAKTLFGMTLIQKSGGYEYKIQQVQ
jgi:hypothetical protein